MVETGTGELIASSVSLVLYLGLLGTSMRRTGRLDKCEIGGEKGAALGRKSVTASVQQVQKK